LTGTRLITQVQLRNADSNQHSPSIQLLHKHHPFHFSLFTFHFSLFTLTLAPTSVKISIAHSCFNTHPFVKRQPYPSSSHHQHPFSSFICPKHITTITKQHFGIFTITTTNFKSTGSGSETVGYSAHRSHRSFWHFSHYG